MNDLVFTKKNKVQLLADVKEVVSLINSLELSNDPIVSTAHSILLRISSFLNAIHLLEFNAIYIDPTRTLFRSIIEGSTHAIGLLDSEEMDDYYNGYAKSDEAKNINKLLGLVNETIKNEDEKLPKIEFEDFHFDNFHVSLEKLIGSKNTLGKEALKPIKLIYSLFSLSSHIKLGSKTLCDSPFLYTRVINYILLAVSLYNCHSFTGKEILNVSKSFLERYEINKLLYSF
jgi:hypothetical protein